MTTVGCDPSGFCCNFLPLWNCFRGMRVPSAFCTWEGWAKVMCLFLHALPLRPLRGSRSGDTSGGRAGQVPGWIPYRILSRHAREILSRLASPSF